MRNILPSLIVEKQPTTTPSMQYENYYSVESGVEDVPGELPPTLPTDATSTAIAQYDPAIAKKSAEETADIATYERVHPIESGASPLARSVRRIGLLAGLGYSLAVGVETAIANPTIAKTLERLTTTENGQAAIGLGVIGLATGIAQEIQFYRNKKRKESFDPISNEPTPLA